MVVIIKQYNLKNTTLSEFVKDKAGVKSLVTEIKQNKPLNCFMLL